MESCFFKGAVKDTKSGMSSHGFKTASGNSISISKEALSRANQLFKEVETSMQDYKIREEIDESEIEEQSTVSKLAGSLITNLPKVKLINTRLSNYNETLEGIKSSMESIGFKTASGKPIDISKEALSRAGQLFKEVETSMRDYKVQEGIVDESEIEEQSALCKPAGSLNTNLPKVKLVNARLSNSDETLGGNKKSMESLGFKTASGNSIKVSKEALTRASQLFKEVESSMQDYKVEEEIDESEIRKQSILSKPSGSLGTNLPKVKLINARSSNPNETLGGIRSPMESLGFKTARGNSIKVSEKALARASQLFKEVEISMQDYKAEECSDEFEFEVVKSTVSEETFKDTKCSLPLSSFKTASGNTIPMSQEALARAKQVFMEIEASMQDLTSEELPDKSEMPVLKFESNMVASSNINLSKESIRLKTLSKDISENTSNSTVAGHPVQKRKLGDSVCSVSSNCKKIRFSNEFQSLKFLHDEKPNARDELTSSTSCSSNIIDENNAMEIEASFSREIAASTVALLADEKSSIISEQCSPVSKSSNEITLNEPSSPVLGSHFVPRRRKGRRNKNIKSSRNKELFEQSDTKNPNVDPVSLGKSAENKQEQLTEKREELEARKEKTCDDASIANEFGDSQIMLDFINEFADILLKRSEAALEQERQIQLKKEIKTRPTISKLYFHKKSNRNCRLSWREISNGKTPTPCTYEELINQKLLSEILDITPETSIEYKFRCVDFYGQDAQNNIDGIETKDGACMILDENGYVGITEIKRAFLASPGVDPNLLPDGWVENHYKWIVWKFASMDRVKFGSVHLPRTLTPEGVMAQLKYRYDREIDRSERSAIRKILEKDDVPSKRMVLCVSSIQHDPAEKGVNISDASTTKLVLTDGWYSISASVDQAMIKNVMSGKVKVGTKLLTAGADLLNCDHGCSPLEASDSVCLKIHTNSTRRARWDLKLGYAFPAGPIPVKLKSVSPSGGFIGKIVVVIARTYPLLYYEKTSTGDSIFRNSKCEEKAKLAYEKEYRAKVEAYYTNAEEYLFNEKKSSSSRSDRIDLVASELNKNREKLTNEECLSNQERAKLLSQCRSKEEEFRRELESRLHESLPLPRQVVPLLKIRVIEDKASAILSIWSPTEEVTHSLREGNHVSITNVAASGERGNELLLATTRNTLFKPKNTSNTVYPQRRYTELCDINESTFAPVYGEFDTVGIVADIVNEPYGRKNFEAVYLAYPNASFLRSTYLSILFWNGRSAFGYTEILSIGSYVACSNLERRKPTSWTIPIAYCTERSIFTRNPRENHLRQPLENLKTVIADPMAYVVNWSVEIAEEARKKSATRNTDFNTPDKTSAEKSSVFSSGKQIGNCTSQSLTTNAARERSESIQRRLNKLQYYSEPSKLSPIVLHNSSKRVSLNFQSPIRSETGKPSKSHVQLGIKFSLPNEK